MALEDDSEDDFLKPVDEEEFEVDQSGPIKKGSVDEERATDGPSSLPFESPDDDRFIEQAMMDFGGRVLASATGLLPFMAVVVGFSAGVGNLIYRIIRRLTAWI